MMSPPTIFRILAYASVLPLLYAVLLALYQYFGWSSVTGIHMSFAHINAYIYAHGYGSVLLALFAGMQLGYLMNQQQPAYAAFYFVLVFVGWISQQSYADFFGIAFLLFCWLLMLLIDWQLKTAERFPKWYSSLRTQISLMIMTLLMVLLLVNG